MSGLNELARLLADDIRPTLRHSEIRNIRKFIENEVDNSGRPGVDDVDREELIQAIEVHLNASRGSIAAEAGTTVADSKAPYRFVAISEQRVFAHDDVTDPTNNLPLPGGFSGFIDVEWAAETPLLIGDTIRENGQDVDVPLRLGNDYVIPGATLRGLVRSTMEIVTRARLTQVNRHHRYGVRDFDHKLFAEGERRLAWSKIRAGWLRLATDADPEREEGDSKYVIVPCNKHLIRIRDLPDSTGDGEWHLEWLRKTVTDRYAAMGMRSGVLFNFEKMFSFTTGSKVVQRMENLHGLIVDGNGSIQGVPVFAGKSPALEGMTAEKLDDQDDDQQEGRIGNQKKLECVFEDVADAQPVRLKQSAFDRFELIHSRSGKNKREPDGTYKVLLPTLNAGKRIPIFMAGTLDDQEGDIDKQARLDIGLTRLFKIGHEQSVGQILGKHGQHRLAPGLPDMVEALFGFVYEPNDLADYGLMATDASARKGRIGFGIARLKADGPAPKVQETLTTATMGVPRASFAPFYLRGAVKDWSAPEARVAGRKRYFPRFASLDDRTRATEAIRGNLVRGKEATLSHMRFLESSEPGRELVFEGRIKLHNVLAEEIGALLWTLTHGGDPRKPYRHMVGRAKPAGAGQMRVKSIVLHLTGHDSQADNELVAPRAGSWELPGADGREGWTLGKQSLQPFMQKFEHYMRESGGGEDWPQVPDIREWLGVSDPSLCKDKIISPGRDKHLANEGTSTFPPGFGRLRSATKARAGGRAQKTTPDRLLPAPAVDRVVTPYGEPE